MTDVVYLNGRQATAWEAGAIDAARVCEHARDLAVLGGLLAEEGPPRVVPQGQDLPAIHAEIRQRRTVDDLALPVLR